MTKTLSLNRSEVNAVLRGDFSAFIERSFYELNPETEYLPNWHVEVIAAALRSNPD